jgi:hypothetical protein
MTIVEFEKLLEQLVKDGEIRGEYECLEHEYQSCLAWNPLNDFDDEEEVETEVYSGTASVWVEKDGATVEFTQNWELKNGEIRFFTDEEYGSWKIDGIHGIFDEDELPVDGQTIDELLEEHCGFEIKNELDRLGEKIRKSYNPEPEKLGEIDCDQPAILERDCLPPLMLCGEKVSENTIYGVSLGINWFVTLYATNDDRRVLHIYEDTRWQGEKDRQWLKVCDDEADLKNTLQKLGIDSEGE